MRHGASRSLFCLSLGRGWRRRTQFLRYAGPIGVTAFVGRAFVRRLRAGWRRRRFRRTRRQRGTETQLRTGAHRDQNLGDADKERNETANQPWAATEEREPERDRKADGRDHQPFLE